MTKYTDMSNAASSLSIDSAMTALAKLSTSIVKQQEAAIKHQEEKSDNRLKSWKILPKIQQNMILQDGINENGKIPRKNALDFGLPKWSLS